MFVNLESDMPQPRHYNPEYCLGLELNSHELVKQVEALELEVKLLKQGATEVMRYLCNSR